MSKGREDAGVGNSTGGEGKRRGADLSGFAASGIGFTWLGYVLAGVILGTLLDKHFHTAFWLPVLSIGGAVAGFREILVLTRRLSQENAKKPREQRQALSTVALTAGAMKQAINEAVSPKLSEEQAVEDEVEVTESAVPRFSVPPPPLAEHEKRRGERKS